MSKSDQKLIAKALKIQEAKKQAAEIERKWRKEQKEVIEEMQERGITAIELDEMRLSLVEGETNSLNYEKLRDKIGEKKWKSICVLTPSQEKLAEAVQEGRIKLSTVEKCTTTMPRTPYIRLSGKGV